MGGWSLPQGGEAGEAVRTTHTVTGNKFVEPRSWSRLGNVFTRSGVNCVTSLGRRLLGPAWRTARPRAMPPGDSQEPVGSFVAPGRSLDSPVGLPSLCPVRNRLTVRRFHSACADLPTLEARPDGSCFSRSGPLRSLRPGSSVIGRSGHSRRQKRGGKRLGGNRGVVLTRAAR